MSIIGLFASVAMVIVAFVAFWVIAVFVWTVVSGIYEYFKIKLFF